MQEVVKHSKNKIKEYLESAVSSECRATERGLWFCVDELEASGKPVDKIRVWATLHYLPSGSPFNNTDPNKTLWLFEDRLQRIQDSVSSAFGLRQTIKIEFIAINANVHQDVIDMESFYLSALMSKPKDINRCSADGITPLMYYAGIMPQQSIVDLLLRYGADPLAKDSKGKAVLDYASQANL